MKDAGEIKRIYKKIKEKSSIFKSKDKPLKTHKPFSFESIKKALGKPLENPLKKKDDSNKQKELPEDYWNR